MTKVTNHLKALSQNGWVNPLDTLTTKPKETPDFKKGPFVNFKKWDPSLRWGDG